MDLEMALIAIPIFLLALTIHEFSHGYAAYLLGDKTAFRAGRLTFNPIKHLDPFGVLVFVLSEFRFGWAKPVPVNLSYTKNPKMADLITSIVGPLSNLAQALVFGIIIRAADIPGDVFYSTNNDFATIIGKFLVYGLYLNCILAYFNLIPIPPLDGSGILFGLLPRRYEHIMYDLHRYGPFILIFLIGFGFLTGRSIIWALIGPPVRITMRLFAGG
jgi:Zn-dependent protease